MATSLVSSSRTRHNFFIHSISPMHPSPVLSLILLSNSSLYLNRSKSLDPQVPSSLPALPNHTSRLLYLRTYNRSLVALPKVVVLVGQDVGVAGSLHPELITFALRLWLSQFARTSFDPECCKHNVRSEPNVFNVSTSPWSALQIFSPNATPQSFCVNSRHSGAHLR